MFLFVSIISAGAHHLFMVFHTYLAVCFPSSLRQSFVVQLHQIMEFTVQFFSIAYLYNMIAKFGGQVQVSFPIKVYLVE